MRMHLFIRTLNFAKMNGTLLGQNLNPT